MPAAHPRPRRMRAVAAVAALGLVVTACGDDESETSSETTEVDETTTTSGDFVVAPEDKPYCDAVAELDSLAGPPTAEQMAQLKEVRPDAIGEDLDAVVDALIAADGDFGVAFSAPAMEERLGRVEDWEAEHCDGGDAEEEDEAATEPLEGAAVIPVSGVDFAFEGIPAEIAAGPTSFEFTNDGESAHEMGLARLGEGVDLDELLARGEEPSPEEAEELGFTFAEPGGDPTYLNVEDLEPGTYAVVCFIPGPGGKAHHELGMKTTFTVS